MPTLRVSGGEYTPGEAEDPVAGRRLEQMARCEAVQADAEEPMKSLVTAIVQSLVDVPEEVQIVRSAAEYRRARGNGKHAAFIGIQGGNALDRDLDALDLIPDDLVLRITLVHLSSSRLGVTSAPGISRRDEGLSPFGRDFVRRLNDKRIFVDLAHINRRGFFSHCAPLL